MAFSYIPQIFLRVSVQNQIGIAKRVIVDMALQERNEVNNYEHYKCGEKI